MKEFYVAPEVKRLAFRPQEELASGVFDDLLHAGESGAGGTEITGVLPETGVESGDVQLPL